MLPVLLKLLHMPTVLEQVPRVLTDLLQRSPAMQKAANDSDAVSSLTTILHHENTWYNRPHFKVSMAGSAILFPRVNSSSVYVFSVNNLSNRDILMNGTLLLVWKRPFFLGISTQMPSWEGFFLGCGWNLLQVTHRL